MKACTGSWNRAVTTALVALTALVLVACATPQRRIQDHPQIYAKATPEQQTLISQGRIAMGFTPEFVRLALGTPDRVTQHTDKTGTQTVWHYVDYRGNVTYVGAFGFGGPWYPFYGPFFGPSVIVQQPRDDDRLRVTFDDGKVSDINRVVHG